MSKSSRVSIDFLWHSFLKGDDKSFAVIYQQHIDSLLSYGYKLSQDKELVSDCIQDIFLELYYKRENLSGNIKNPKAYLFIALRNNIVKKVEQYRKQNSMEIKECLFEDMFNTEYSYQDKLIEMEISSEIKNKLNMAVNSLPPRQKEIIYLKFEEELAYIEISEILMISVESARKLLHRAILSLREIVKPSRN